MNKITCTSMAAAAFMALGLVSPADAGWFSDSTGAEESSGAVVAAAKAYAARQEDWMQPFAYALYRDGEWGAVLNFERLGLAAMEKQRTDIARRAFDQAIERVEAIYADDANAVKARSVFNAEAVKDFKGEPYERAMLYYYRGLLYLQDGDYQNARAAFLAADRHVSLSSAEDTHYASDFGLLKYLAGWASACDGDAVRAQQLIAEARASDKLVLSLSELPPTSLVLVDAGRGPVKFGAGSYREVLKFKPGNELAPAFVVSSGTAALPEPVLAADLNHQAMTRGGREVDGIMQGKARFKDGSNTVGDAALVVGRQAALLGALSGDRGTANAGLAGMLIGMFAKGISASTTPAADTRMWDSLPAQLMLFSAALPADQSTTITVNARNSPMSLRASTGACAFAWARTDSALATSMGGIAAMPDTKPVETNRGDRNKAMRAMLVNELTVAAK